MACASWGGAGRGRVTGAQTEEGPRPGPAVCPDTPGGLARAGASVHPEAHPTPPWARSPVPRRVYLPLQQLLRPHVLGKELLPRAAVGQRAVAQVVFKEGEEWNQKWQTRGCQAPGLPPAPLLAPRVTLPTCQGRGVQSWQHPVLSGGRKRLETGREATQCSESGQRAGGPPLCRYHLPTT